MMHYHHVIRYSKTTILLCNLALYVYHIFPDKVKNYNVVTKFLDLQLTMLKISQILNTHNKVAKLQIVY